MVELSVGTAVVRAYAALRSADAQSLAAQEVFAARDDEALDGSGAHRLTVQETHDNCRVIFFTGHDPSASILTWLIGLLCQHPGYTQRIRQELQAVVGDREIQYSDLTKLTLLSATIKETMRLYPAAVAVVPRRVQRTFSYNGWNIEKDSVLHLPIWHIHHDARWFPEPEVFRPERFMPDAPKLVKGSFLPFGGGARICLGQQFATTELVLIAAILLQRFNFEVEKDFALPAATMALSFEPATPIHVKFVPRRSIAPTL
jgi:cytochrome P450